MAYLYCLAAALGVLVHLVPNTLCTSNGDGDINNKFRDPSVVQDKGHLKEHVKELTEEEINQMSPEEMEWHFFKSHDSDQNLELDGLEILAAVDHQQSGYNYQSHEDRMKSYTGLVDRILDDDDIDDDGMISWLEYVISRRRHEAEAKAAREQRDAETKQ